MHMIRGHLSQFEYRSEGEWFHAMTCKMNYTCYEYADMHINLGEESRNLAEAERLYAENFLSPNA